MIQNKYSSPLFNQTNDLIWMVDHLCLMYANKDYLNLMKEVTGKEKKRNEQIFEEGFGDSYIERMRGEVWIVSILGKGFTFNFTIPKK